MEIDFLTILTIVIYCIGAVQGIVFGVILLNSKGPNQIANRLLAIILFLLSYRLLVLTMRIFGLGYYDTWYYFHLDYSWAYGALLLFYVKAMVTPDFDFQRKDWIHVSPLLIQVGFSIFVRLQNLYWDGTRESLSWLGYWGYVIWMNYSTIYVVASLLIISYAFQAQKLLKLPLKGFEIQAHRIIWLKRILWAFVIYFSLILFVLILDFTVVRLGFDESYFYFTRFYYYPFFAGLAVLTYWLGIEGFRRKDDLGLLKVSSPSPEEKDQFQRMAKALETYMAEAKPFKDPELTLSRLAGKLEVKPYLLSRCLGVVFEKRFSDYVNSFRVKEIEELLTDSENNKFTLLALAMEAGFNSKSSFNRAVKRQLGISPQELKEKVQGVNS